MPVAFTNVIWSFALGGSLATAAGSRLRQSESIFVNKYFIFTVCYLGVIFTPLSVYLLLHFTAWSTLFWCDQGSVSAAQVCVFTSSNVFFGILGFYSCASLMKAGRQRTANLIWTGAYTCVFSIVSFGYNRFLYAGTAEEWRAGVKFPLMDFFHCKVFYHILAMSGALFPPLYHVMVTWPAGPDLIMVQKTELLREAVKPYVRLTGLVISAFLLLFASGMLPLGWHIDRLLAFFFVQSLFGFAIFTPMYMIRTPEDTATDEELKQTRRTRKKPKTN